MITRQTEQRGKRAIAAAIVDLRELLDDRCVTGLGVREHHARDESWLTAPPPDAVVFPQDTAEVSQILQVCSTYGCPVIAFGAGSSLEGQILAISGGICVNMTRMAKVLTVWAEDQQCRVQPGLTWDALNRELRDSGLFFPVDPGAEATLGGMASTRASGTNAVRYGTMRDMILAMEVVLSDGRIVRVGSRARKSAAGYDLTALFTGAEGTLGIITELTLRLFGIPEAFYASVVTFPTVERAVQCVTNVIQWGLPVNRIELLDPIYMEAINTYSHLDFPVLPTLFVEFSGTEEGVRDQASKFKAIAGDFEAAFVSEAIDEDNRRRIWAARHTAFFAALQLRPGSRALTTDVCVPISNLPAAICAAKFAIDAAGLIGPFLGHVGDGNFHVQMLIDPENPAEVDKAEEAHKAIVTAALALDGTCSGEHGIGLGKQVYLQMEHRDAIPVMRLMKQALDPTGILNPGKIFI